ncbi:MAG: DUF1294 domain-containing protein [Clostridia bacterium]|nr:DUF1294 domain-containing protein [Clostridia bacterium]
MNNYIIPVCIYLAIISIITVIITIYDKSAAKRNKRRVSEASLMLLGLAGGALAELITMKIIRHKTKHPKFMIGLPVEIIIHIAAICFLFFLKP